MLIFMLLLVAAASYALITKLNASRKPYVRDLVTNQALAEAKQALISYAVTYPEEHNNDFGPGYLPCPDRNKDGEADGACAIAGPTNFTIGRFPWKTLKTNDLKDSSGERFWYVLSENYRNNPKLEPLNSETQGQLSIDIDADGDIDAADINDVVAIIIAPQEAINNQTRDASETDIALEIANFLEDENNNFDNDFVVSKWDIVNEQYTINDRLVYITRSELMEQVEKRILGDAKQILSNYFATYNAYPWLSPFADPKTVEKRLIGNHSGANDQLISLTDSSASFTQWGVTSGDTVWNITDGSYGVVTEVTPTTLTIGEGLNLGVDNHFDTNDEYYVDVSSYSNVFIGTATTTSGSSNLTLEDTTKDFDALGVKVGDIVEIVADGSSGIINNVSSTELTVSSLSGATNIFSNGVTYRIRTSMGRATTDSDANGLTLEDTNVDFTVMGIRLGDLIRNLTDGSYGTVTNVTANRLTVSELVLGTNNVFTKDDYYTLPRFNSVTDTRKGLLGFYEIGESQESKFNIDWSAQEVNGAAVSIYSTGNHPSYDNSITQFVQASTGTLGTVTVDNGNCSWIQPKIIECKAGYTHASIQGTVSSGTGSGSNFFKDSSKNFGNLGVSPGDIVLNYDDEDPVITGTAEVGSSGTTLVDVGAFSTLSSSNNYNLLVQNDDMAGKAQAILSEVVDNDTIKVIDYVGESGAGTVTFNPGDDYTVYSARRLVVDDVPDSETIQVNRLTSASPDLDTGEFYGIKSATGKLSGTATGGSSGTLLEDTGQNFNAIQIGDVVFNNNDNAWGQITNVDVVAKTITAQLYRSDGSTRSFSNGETYDIYYSYVNTRNYKFALRFSGDLISQEVNELRYRDVCLGYTNCTGSSSNVSLPYYDLGISSAATAGSVGLILNDSAINFLNYGIKSGDTVFNITDGSNGIVDTVGTNQIIVKSLAGGTNVFSVGDSYRISRPMITIEDYDSNNNLIGNATVTIPNGGATGSINISNIQYQLHSEGVDLNGDGDYNDAGDVQNDIPDWFINNDWHKLVYVAFSSGDAPNTGVDCAAGSNCLTVNFAAASNDDVNALVIAAGAETNKILDSTCSALVSTAQDRTNGTINEYFESENCDQSDDLFQEQMKTDTYNDQVLIIRTSP
jgi:hypothetical protein